jgi:predicted nucleic acid-binding Zn ribbon protein
LICGKPIDPNSRRKKYCSDKCGAIGNAQHAKENRELLKSEKKVRPKKITLDKTLKALNKYNKQHGTNISYGEYSRMMGL